MAIKVILVCTLFSIAALLERRHLIQTRRLSVVAQELGFAFRSSRKPMPFPIRQLSFIDSMDQVEEIMEGSLNGLNVLAFTKLLIEERLVTGDGSSWLGIAERRRMVFFAGPA